MNQDFTVKKSNICLKKKFVQGVSPGKKIPSQAVREKTNRTSFTDFPTETRSVRPGNFFEF